MKQCNPPAKFRSESTGWLADTWMTNDYCVDNGNWAEVTTIIVFLGYLITDFLICYLLIGDAYPGRMENYLHHAIGVFGSGSSLFVGRMILTLSGGSCFTELSTPFVSMRALLAYHGKSSSKLYLVNGLLMTIVFFLCRNVFQTWLVLCRLIPSIFQRSEMFDDVYIATIICCYISCTLYMCLVCLNFFWFYKMITGLLKFIAKDKKGQKTSPVKERTKLE